MLSEKVGFGLSDEGFKELVALDKQFKTAPAVGAPSEAGVRTHAVLNYISFFQRHRFHDDLVTSGRLSHFARADAFFLTGKHAAHRIFKTRRVLENEVRLLSLMKQTLPPTSFLQRGHFLGYRRAYSENIIRQAIFKVFAHSCHILWRITSADEFFRRIMVTLTSNDPEARAMTLRLIAFTAEIGAERVEVHWRIRLALDSQTSTELYAALSACEAFTRRSSKFSKYVIHRLADLLKEHRHDVDVLLRVVNIYRHMWHTSALVETAHQVLLTHLEDAASDLHTVHILRSLTWLALKSQHNMEKLVKLLVQIATAEVDEMVIYVALNMLGSLAGPVVKFEVDEFLSILTLSTKHQRLRRKALSVALRLTQHEGLVTDVLRCNQLDCIKEALWKDLHVDDDGVNIAGAKVMRSLREAAELVSVSFVSEAELLDAALEIAQQNHASPAQYKVPQLLLTAVILTAPNVPDSICESLWARPTGIIQKGNLDVAMLRFIQRCHGRRPRPSRANGAGYNYEQLACVLRLLDSSSSESERSFIQNYIPDILSHLCTFDEGPWLVYKLVRGAMCKGEFSSSLAGLRLLQTKVVSAAGACWLQLLHHVNAAALLWTAGSAQDCAESLNDCLDLAKLLRTLSTTPRHFVQRLLALHHRAIPLLHNSTNLGDGASLFADELKACARDYDLLAYGFADIDAESIEVLHRWATMLRENASPKSPTAFKRDAGTSNVRCPPFLPAYFFVHRPRCELKVSMTPQWVDWRDIDNVDGFEVCLTGTIQRRDRWKFPEGRRLKGVELGVEVLPFQHAAHKRKVGTQRTELLPCEDLNAGEFSWKTNVAFADPDETGVHDIIVRVSWSLIDTRDVRWGLRERRLLVRLF
ncbi:Integrator complex subunit 7 [Gaertneriomyces sp. JEL0708]|nr:Integrator complex subunit 7 [Gaertneriomyces sp. JEL0708]